MNWRFAGRRRSLSGMLAKFSRLSTDFIAEGRSGQEQIERDACNDAQRAIDQAIVSRLSLADQECVAQALLSPSKPSPALERAFAHRGKLLRARR